MRNKSKLNLQKPGKESEIMDLAEGAAVYFFNLNSKQTGRIHVMATCAQLSFFLGRLF